MPTFFGVDDDVAWTLVRDAGVGVLVVATSEGLRSVLAPADVSEDRATLRAHVARANPWWRGVEPGAEVLASFLAASAYVSPSNYPSTRDDPRVVPTWDYEAVEVRGRVWVHEDREWLRGQVTDLTDRFESGRDPRWRVADAEPDYLERMLGAIVGLEVRVTSIIGARKLSQNRSAEDHEGVHSHLATGTALERHVASRMTTPA